MLKYEGFLNFFKKRKDDTSDLVQIIGDIHSMI